MFDEAAMRASRQWASRPADERYTSLEDMRARFTHQRSISRASAHATRSFEARPVEGENDVFALEIAGLRDEPSAPTHWAFGQLCERAGAPAGYLRTLPAAMVSDCLNYGLRFKRDMADVGILTRCETNEPQAVLAAATGPNYGRIWNDDALGAIIDRFGNGRDGQFRVPGEWGKPVEITKDKTTLYASDRDFFIFLADEGHAFEVPNRRQSLVNSTGLMSRGFFAWNSEVGSQTYGIATFLFDYVCGNRIVWGMKQFEEIRIRHTVSAPLKFIEQVAPALERYAQSETGGIEQIIAAAQAKRIGKDSDEIAAFLTKRFSKQEAVAIVAAHEAEEARPIETLWDAVVGATAWAKGKQHQDVRVGFERKAGQLLDLVAA